MPLTYVKHAFISASTSFLPSSPASSSARLSIERSRVRTAFSASRHHAMTLQHPVIMPLHSSTGIPPRSLLHAGTFLAMERQDVSLAGGIVAFLAVWLLLWQQLTALKVVASTVTRKVVHISSGAGFLLLWPFFSDAGSARFVAATMPLGSIALLIFSGYARDGERRGALGRALSRGGKAGEALQGPLYYCTVLLVLTLLFFKSAAAAIAIMQLCFGDGAAEVIGRRFGAKSRWGLSWTGDKSIAGSIAFFIAAFCGSCWAVEWFHYHNLTQLSVYDPLTSCTIMLISAACAALELGPREVLGDDNLTIAAAATALSVVLFGTKALY